MDQLRRAATLHHRACTAVRPDPEDLAGRLFTRECADLWGIFWNLDARYADVLGEAGRQAFRRRVEDAWAAAIASPDGITGDPPVDTGILRPMIDRLLEEDGDLDGRIALRTRDLHAVEAYIDLIRLCRDHDRPDQAVHWADEALFLFEGTGCDDLDRVATRAFAAAGLTDRAIATLWRLFERRPTLDDFRALRDLGGDALVDRAIAALRRRAETEPSGGWDHPADLLIAVLMDEARFDDAWDAQRSFGASQAAAERLARATELSHPADAIRAYTLAIDEAVKSGTHQGYHHAAALLNRLASMRSAGQQALHIHHLRKVFKRKRNFMALLPDV
jgi:tetratricopeptide (TPR) repeat protein